MVEAWQLEQPKCPLCGDSQNRQEYSFQPFAVVSCLGCRLYYLSPRLIESEMLKVYQDSSYFEGSQSGRAAYQSYASQELSLRLTFRELFRNLSLRNVTGGSLLEVGCGYGYLLREASAYMSRLVGTDYSQSALNQISLPKAELYLGGIDQVPEGEKFDLIVATHVLEHTYDPLRFIRSLVSRLKPGGSMLLATPDLDSPIRWLMGRRWPSFKVPEHTLYFNQESLRRAMSMGGLRQSQLVPYPHAFPLSLLAGKFGIRLPDWLGRKILWIPTSTVAVLGSVRRKPSNLGRRDAFEQSETLSGAYPAVSGLSE
jgi:SAM-dependent methyltransferase